MSANSEIHITDLHRSAGQALSSTAAFSPAVAKKVRAFHQTFPGYKDTPLVSLPHLAEALGVSAIHVKDESWRFGLNAFKVLGSSYAIGNVIARQLGMDISALTYEDMVSPAALRELGPTTFITATDGNHGRGVAWTANRLHQNCVVYMPAGSAPERLRNIQALGADASITGVNYDSTVQLARQKAEENGWVLVQDTSWPGYEEIPGWIMQGYLTMGAEVMEQLHGELPTHVFLQAGVGSMAAAICGFFAPHAPVITIVEPDQADCFYRTAAANDGKIHSVTGEMHSIMAGLCCGVPSPLAWDILRDHADHFVSMPDYVAADGMRILGNPLRGDTPVISGESGASAFGLVTEILRRPELASLKEQLGLGEHSRILCFSTEGDTFREGYRRIVWDGACAK